MMHCIWLTQVMSMRVGTRSEIDLWLVRIFSAKCLDLKIKPTQARRDRFLVFFCLHGAFVCFRGLPCVSVYFLVLPSVAECCRML